MELDIKDFSENMNGKLQLSKYILSIFVSIKLNSVKSEFIKLIFFYFSIR